MGQKERLSIHDTKTSAITAFITPSQALVLETFMDNKI